MSASPQPCHKARSLRKRPIDRSLDASVAFALFVGCLLNLASTSVLLYSPCECSGAAQRHGSTSTQGFDSRHLPVRSWIGIDGGTTDCRARELRCIVVTDWLAMRSVRAGARRSNQQSRPSDAATPIRYRKIVQEATSSVRAPPRYEGSRPANGMPEGARALRSRIRLAALREAISVAVGVGAPPLWAARGCRRLGGGQ